MRRSARRAHYRNLSSFSRPRRLGAAWCAVRPAINIVLGAPRTWHGRRPGSLRRERRRRTSSSRRRVRRVRRQHARDRAVLFSQQPTAAATALPGRGNTAAQTRRACRDARPQEARHRSSSVPKYFCYHQRFPAKKKIIFFFSQRGESFLAPHPVPLPSTQRGRPLGNAGCSARSSIRRGAPGSAGGSGDRRSWAARGSSGKGHLRRRRRLWVSVGVEQVARP